MAVGDDKIADFTVDNYAAFKLKRSAEGNLLRSVPHRYRLFFNLGDFRPQGSHVLPQRL